MDINRLMTDAVEAHHNGRHAEARAVYDRILADMPDQPDALHYRGLLRHQTGDTQGALSDLAAAVQGRGNDPGIRFNYAEVLREAGDAAAALEHYRKVISAAPGDADARFGLANAAFDLGHFRDAAEAYRAAIRLNPNDPEFHNNLGNALAQLGFVEEATEAYRQAVRLAPDYIEATTNLADILGLGGHGGEAREVWAELDQRLARARREDTEARIARARARVSLGDSAAAVRLLETAAAAGAPATRAEMEQIGWTWAQMQRWRAALEAFQAAADAGTPDPALECQIGNALIELRQPEAAHEAYSRAETLAPGHIPALLGAGRALQQVGQFEDAAEKYRAVIAAEPGNGLAWYQLASARQLEAGDELGRLRALAADPEHPEEVRESMHFAAGDVLDRLGEYDAAFAHYAAGNAMRSARNPFDLAGWRAQTDRLIELFDAEFFKQRKGFGDPGDLPVFVLGMPRSGTTLTEQILASHPEAHGAGELYELEDTVRRARLALPDNAAEAAYPGFFAALAEEDSARLGADHIARLRACDESAARVVDKMPGNFARLGAIALLLPGAQVVHTRRNAVDTCLSCYFQNFRSLEFTFDLEVLGGFFRDYLRLMAHWEKALPLEIFDLRYEDLTGDPEPWSRKLVAHTGLAWDDACLAYHKGARPIATASTWQARQPVYTTSVERWKRYEKHLGPLIEALGDAADMA